MIYHKRYKTCLLRKSKIFTPFLQYCQILQNWVLRQNERSEEKSSVIFGFRIKSYTFLNIIISFLRLKFRFTTKIKKFWKKSQIFNDFLTLKYNISGAVCPILVNFFANHWQFCFLFRWKRKVKKNFKISKKNWNC